MRTAWLFFLTASCAPRVTPTPPRPRECALGAPVTLVGTRVVADYPQVRVSPPEHDLAVTKAGLEKRLPGWRVVVSEHGNVTRLETIEPVGPKEVSISTARVERVRAALAAIGLATDHSRARPAPGYEHYAEIDELYIGQQIAAPSDPAQVILRIDLPDVPAPPTVPLLTDDEVHALWGIDWRQRQATVTTYYQGHPCDMAPDYPHACDGAGPREEIACVPLAELALTRRAIESPQGVRRVIVAGVDKLQGYGDFNALSAAVPLCIDGVTGEGVPLELCAPEARHPLTDGAERARSSSSSISRVRSSPSPQLRLQAEVAVRKYNENVDPTNHNVWRVYSEIWGQVLL